MPAVNPAPVRVRVSWALCAGNSGLDELVLNSKEYGPLNPARLVAGDASERVAFREAIGRRRRSPG